MSDSQLVTPVEACDQKEDETNAEVEEGGNDEEKDEEEVGEDEVLDDGEIGSQFSESKLQLEDELKTIRVTKVRPVEELDPKLFPPSYKNNTAKEEKAIGYCKTFLKQYNHLFNQGRPLFLKPRNEFGVQKVVCTTINPTQLPYKDLLDWPDIALFVAEHLDYDALDQPHVLPDTLFAPQSTLERQHGHCFEYSTLLCSMLIGSGYDAYVVSGYASREVCMMDLSYTRCPLIDEDLKVYPRPQSINVCKYRVRPKRDLFSEFVLRMQIKDAAAKKEIEDENRRLEDVERQVVKFVGFPHLYGDGGEIIT